MTFHELMIFAAIMTLCNPITYAVIGGSAVLYVFRPKETLKVLTFFGWIVAFIVSCAWTKMVLFPFITEMFS